MVVLGGLLCLSLAWVLLVSPDAEEDGQHLQMRMSNAAGLIEGTPILIGGADAGEIEAVDVQGGEAVIDVRVDGDHAPMRSGSTASVTWEAALGERHIEITPAERGKELPDGGTIPVKREQVDVDQLLAALDAKTREGLSGTIKGLRETLQGRERDTAEVLEAGGPSVKALAEVMRAVGEDGHAIRRLVSDLQALVGPAAGKGSKLASTVDDLTATASKVAGKERSVKRALAELPPTLGAADDLLTQVGPAVKEARPLLRDLQPAARKLTPVARKLSPVLRDLRPTMANLGPVVSSANRLLNSTPPLLDNAHATLPTVTTTVKDLNPAVDFLRPYTPDLMGWLSNWGSAFAGYDAVGHYASAVIRAGVSSIDENPGLPLTLDVDPRPAPGKAGGSPWTDANGSEMR